MRNLIALFAATLLLAAPLRAGAVDAPKPKPSTALTAAELRWLTPMEASSYKSKYGQAKTDAERAAADATARYGVEMSLPEDARGGYRAATKDLSTEKGLQGLNTFFQGVVALSPGEEAKLGMKDPAALQKYKSEHATRLQSVEEMRGAHEVVAKYRGMIQPSSKGKGAGNGGTKKDPKTGEAQKPHKTARLTLRERGWLDAQQAKLYSQALNSKKKLDWTKTNANYRGYVAADVPGEYQQQYKDLVAGDIDAGKIDALMRHIVELEKDEKTALQAITKEKVPASANATLKGASALDDYLAEMKPYFKTPKSGGDPYTLPKDCRAAAPIAAKYRALKAAVDAASGKQPETKKPETANGPRKSKLSDQELAALTRNERKAWDALTTDDARAQFIADNQAAIDERLTMKRPKTAADFNGLTANQKKKFCDDLDAGTVPAQYTVVTGAKNQLKTGSMSDDQLKGMMDGDVRGQADAVPTTSNPQPPKDEAAAIADLCKEFARNQPLPPSKSEKGSLANKEPPDPSKTSGSDKADPKSEEKKPNPNVYKNIANGMGYGLFGALVGSFFGGPAAIFLFAAVAGAGAYALSAHINPDPNKKKKDGGDA